MLLYKCMGLAIRFFCLQLFLKVRVVDPDSVGGDQTVVDIRDLCRMIGDEVDCQRELTDGLPFVANAVLLFWIAKLVCSF